MNPLHYCLQGDLCSLEGHQGPQHTELKAASPLTAWNGRKGMEFPCVLHCRNTSTRLPLCLPCHDGGTSRAVRGVLMVWPVLVSMLLGRPCASQDHSSVATPSPDCTMLIALDHVRAASELWRLAR